MDDLGIAKLVVGIEISRPSEFQYSLCQSRYAEAVLERFNMKNDRPASTPFPPGLKLYQATDHKVEQFKALNQPYRGVVGLLMYLSQCNRPDPLGHVVGVLSEHLARPRTLHWDAALHVLRYLKSLTNLGIIYSGDAHTKVTGLESKNCPVSHCNSDD